MKSQLITITLSALALASACAQDADTAAFAKAAAAGAATELPADQTGVKGADPEWYFFYKELAHLATDEFWSGDYSTTASKIDPAPLITEYSAKLKELGVELLVVPAPAKASIYPEKFTTSGKPQPLAPFLKSLADAGVKVLDLEPVFNAELAKNPDKQLYCKTDSHYSPSAAQLIANTIHEAYKDSGWAKALKSDIKFTLGDAKDLKIKGDLTGSQTETLSAVEVTGADSEQVPADDADSPIVLLGDSHTAVFSTGGELHTTGCGLPDHLQAKFGARIHQVSNNGSGTHQARIQLLRKAHSTPGYWDNKKLVIWHFSVRELTQAPKWVKIPPKP